MVSATLLIASVVRLPWPPKATDESKTMDDPKAVTQEPDQADLAWAAHRCNQKPSGVVSYSTLVRVRDTLASTVTTFSTNNPTESDPGDFELYHAFRDVLAPRVRELPQRAIWRADLIRYTGLPLIGDEPCRSIGHWNPADQVEAFEVLHGHVVMLVMSKEGKIGIVSCLPGVSWVLPRGAFHLTYALRPSLVINIYNAPDFNVYHDKYARQSIPRLHVRCVDGAVTLARVEDQRVDFVTINDTHNFCVPLPKGLRGLHRASDDAFVEVMGRF